MTKLTQVNFLCPEKLLKEFDEAAEKAKFSSRVEALRALIRDFVNQHKED